MSQFRTRLTRLRSQSGDTPETSLGSTENNASESKTDLRGRINKLSTSKVSRSTSRLRLSECELAEQLGGLRLSEGLVVIEQSLQFGVNHGRARIGEGLEQALSFFGHKDGAVAFMDTETTGLAGGTGTVVFLLGLGRSKGTHFASPSTY